MTEILEPDHHELEEGGPSPLLQAAMPEGAMYCSTSFQPLMRRPLLQRFRPGFLRQGGCGGGQCFFPGTQGDQHRFDRFRQFMPGNQNQMWSQIINLLNNIVRRLEQMNGRTTPNPNPVDAQHRQEQLPNGQMRHYHSNGYVDRGPGNVPTFAAIGHRMYTLVPGTTNQWSVAESGSNTVRREQGQITLANGRLVFVPRIVAPVPPLPFV